MRLVVYNGSPRMQGSNSRILIQHFLDGYARFTGDSAAVAMIGKQGEREKHLELFRQSDHVIIVFPLYTDCMPGIVKAFFEELFELDHSERKHIGFIVQSGFPEAVQSVYVARYLEKLCTRLNAEYSGTVIRGGVEGLQMMPSWMTKRLLRKFEQLGEHYARTGAFSALLRAELARPFTLSPLRKLIVRLMAATGAANFYWNSRLKQHGAFGKRFARPFSRGPENGPTAADTSESSDT
ncbi:NAD(P)H-dependent oxidoreductase [bacterium]|nr:NAD(P)H-dependent oxidoreductase [bacterium]